MGDASARFPRRCRLLSAPEFQFVFQKPRRVSSNLMTVLARPSGRGETRLGLVVARKCDKRATRRNRIKRLVRESFRHNQYRLTGLDVVVIAKPAMSQADNPAIAADLDQHWGTLQKWHESRSG